jgi:hypothetical protein
MRIHLFITVLSLGAAGLAAAQAYKWVDEDGVVHYSDRPQPGAEVLELPRQRPPSSVPAPRSAPPPAAAETPEEPSPGYDSLEISNPGPEVTLWNIEGTLNVTLNLQPALKPGHQVRAHFDGEPRSVSGTSFQIEEVYRGVHNLQIEILDETGKMLIRSRTNRFYVQQTSVVRGGG